MAIPGDPISSGMISSLKEAAKNIASPAAEQGMAGGAGNGLGEVAGIASGSIGKGAITSLTLHDIEKPSLTAGRTPGHKGIGNVGSGVAGQLGKPGGRGH
jgi:hypothetical protein